MSEKNKVPKNDQKIPTSQITKKTPTGTKDIDVPKSDHKLNLTPEDIEEAMKPSENDTTQFVNVDELIDNIDNIISKTKEPSYKKLQDKVMEFKSKSSKIDDLSETDKKGYEKARKEYETVMEGLFPKFNITYIGIFHKIIYPLTKQDQKIIAMMLDMVIKIQNKEASIEDIESELGDTLYNKFVEPSLSELDKEKVKKNLEKMKKDKVKKR